MTSGRMINFVETYLGPYVVRVWKTPYPLSQWSSRNVVVRPFIMNR